MKNPRQLFENLLSVDSEDEVIAILKGENYWDNANVWRHYGDFENNFSTINNQMERSDAALVEKIVNSIDAKLISACLERKISPEDHELAPKSINEAVCRFFSGDSCENSTKMGYISNWTRQMRSEVAQGITVSATGNLGAKGISPCFTISDDGEGQMPRDFPETLLSLNKSIKLKVPFVQGKFNMGGSGVLVFCGKQGFQLILSKRNQKLIDGKSQLEGDDHWGFTIVRRYYPADGRRSSSFMYLAPIDSDNHPNKGGVLSFPAKTMPIFPDGGVPYSRHSKHGTLMKLYEYEKSPGYQNTNVIRRGGILRRLDLLLARSPLPIKLHECRVKGGKKRSVSNTVSGMLVRLEDPASKRDPNRDNLEREYCQSSTISVMGEQFIVDIKVFKKGKASTYAGTDGVIYLLNGQVHYMMNRANFFRRSVLGKLKYLSDSIVIFVDCSNISPAAVEELFKNSRDRMSNKALKHAVEEQLTKLLAENVALRNLSAKRRNDQLSENLANNKPLEGVISNLLKSNSAFSRLFNFGERLTNSALLTTVIPVQSAFNGTRHPTYFNFKNKNAGVLLKRNCENGKSVRIKFSTDVENMYFSRAEDKGSFSLTASRNDSPLSVNYAGPTLNNGIANISLTLPEEVGVGDVISIEFEVTDSTLIEPFVNKLELTVIAASKRQTDPWQGPRINPPGPEKGSGQNRPTGLSMPEVREVTRDGWNEDNGFDEHSALYVVVSEEESEDGTKRDTYDFYINMDNVYLHHEMRIALKDVELLKTQYICAMVILGLSMIQSYKRIDVDKRGDIDIEKQIFDFTRSASSVILPLVNTLGNIDPEPAELVAS